MPETLTIEVLAAPVAEPNGPPRPAAPPEQPPAGAAPVPLAPRAPSPPVPAAISAEELEALDKRYGKGMAAQLAANQVIAPSTPAQPAGPTTTPPVAAAPGPPAQVPAPPAPAIPTLTPAQQPVGPVPVVIVSPLPIPVSMAGKSGSQMPPQGTGGKTSPAAPGGLTPAQIQKPYGAVAAAVSVAGDKAGAIGAGLAPDSGAAPVQAALGALSMIPGPIGVMAAAANAATSAITGLASAANSAADKYAQFSGPISAAQARADIREIQGDIRRAQRSGDELAKFIDAQSRATDKWEDIKSRLLNAVLPYLTGILRLLEKIANGFGAVLDNPTLKKIGETYEKTPPWLVGLVNPLMGLLKAIKGNTDPKQEDIEQDLATFDALRKLLAPGSPVMQPRADPALNMPVFGGF